MIECMPQHAGKDQCPDCDSNHHREISALPNRPLSIADCRELTRGREIQGIRPIFRVHTGEQYRKVIPAIVMISGDEVSALQYNPELDYGWITLYHDDGIEEPTALGKLLSDNLREHAYEKDEINSQEVVHPDKELDEAIKTV